jgi:hypothetical protein
MIRKFLFFIFFLLIISCQNKENQQVFIEDFIPNNAQVVLRINSIDVFKSALKNNKLLSKTELKSIFENNLGALDSLQISGPMLLCMTENSNFTFIAQQKHIESKELQKQNYVQDSVWVFSTSDSKTTTLNKTYNHPYKKFTKLSEPNATFSIYVAKEEQSAKEFQLLNNVFLDFIVTPIDISFSGVYTNKSNKWNHLFENILPKAPQLNKVTPSDFEHFESFVYSDFEQFSKNLKIRDSSVVFSEFSKTLLETSQEIATIKTSKGSAIVLHSIDIGASKDILLGFQEQLQLFRSVPIYSFKNDTVFNQSFNGLLPRLNISNYAIIDDVLIFSENEITTEEVISNYINKNTLNNSKAFQNTQQKLSDEVSYQNILNPKKLANYLNHLFGVTPAIPNLETYKNSIIQVVKDDEVVHVHGQLENYHPKKEQKKINEIFSLTLDTAILSEVQFVKNHKTKEKDIVVQDAENYLYLISNQGVVHWKKKLSGSIMGRVNQVDLYKNGRLQMVFSTENRVYVLDRLGKDIGPFPLKFKDKITQAVSVFDYDKNKNYRFLVTQGKSLLAYDGKGKRVKGFSYNPDAEITNAPQHIRYNGKDYIVFGSESNMKILNRKGKIRIKAKEPINFSNQNIYFYNNKFSTLDADGELVQVDLKGRVSKQTLGFDTQTNMMCSSRTLVAQWANQLQIKNNKTTLDFGNYLAPQLFYLKNKIYVSITDLQSQKVTLFDSNGTILSGFPIYGISKIDLSNADKDSALELICQSNDSELIMYQIY